ncbi:MAG: inosine/xanthosine triphosphatase [Acidobacteriota bacterium]|nr:inosine/xanthosine triphosphatase [Acidobacteriota bacterium]
MEKVVVASGNPVKLRAVQDGFLAMFPERNFQWETVSVPSGVADQPLSDGETLRGAMNRVAGAREKLPDARFWVGLEGGMQNREGKLEAFAWIVVQSADRTGRSRTGSFFIPDEIADLVQGGMELGRANDRVFSRIDSKRKEGATGILTGGVIERATFYSPSVILALIPFKNPTLYPVG